MTTPVNTTLQLSGTVSDLAKLEEVHGKNLALANTNTARYNVQDLAGLVVGPYKRQLMATGERWRQKLAALTAQIERLREEFNTAISDLATNRLCMQFGIQNLDVLREHLGILLRVFNRGAKLETTVTAVDTEVFIKNKQISVTILLKINMERYQDWEQSHTITIPAADLSLSLKNQLEQLRARFAESESMKQQLANINKELAGMSERMDEIREQIIVKNLGDDTEAQQMLLGLREQLQTLGMESGLLQDPDELVAAATPTPKVRKRKSR